MRLGHACLTLGMPDSSMRAAQLGRYQKGLVDLAPIYAYNLEYARRSIGYAAAHGLAAYRLSSDVFPLLDFAPEARGEVPSFELIRRTLGRSGVHVSNHPSQFVVLSSPHDHVLKNSIQALDAVVWTMEQIGAEGSITLHGGGVYGDRAATGARLRATITERLTKGQRRLLALENDEKSWTVPELLDAIGGEVPIVFDNLHWAANPRSSAWDEEMRGAIASWPEGRLPEFHYSEQAEDKPRGAHAEWVSGRGLLRFLHEVEERAAGRDCVIVVEAKKKDVAIARAIEELGPRDRDELVRLVPDLARAPEGWYAQALATMGKDAAKCPPPARRVA